MKPIPYVILLVLLVLITSCSNRTSEEIIREGDLDAVINLLDEGTSPNHLDDKDHSMLYYAIRYDQAEIAGALLDRGASCKPSPGSRDLRLFAAETGHKDILEQFLLRYDAFFEEFEDKESFIRLLVGNDWLETLQLYFQALEEYQWDMRYAYDTALEMGRERIASYLAEELRHYWPVSEAGLDPINPDPDIEDVFYNAFTYLEQYGGKLGVEMTSYPPLIPENVLRISSPEDIFEYVIDNMLAKPDMNDDGWASGLKNSYLHNVVAVLPVGLPAITRHDGYQTSRNASRANRFNAYFLHRVNRNPDELQHLWNIWKEVVFEVITVDRYVDLDFHRSVEALLINWDHIRNIPAYGDTLAACYEDLVEMHWDESNRKGVYGWNWWGQIRDCLFCDNPWRVDRGWTASFWIRRYAEGNHEVVAGILDEIRSHYAKDERLEKLVRRRDSR